MFGMACLNQTTPTETKSTFIFWACFFCALNLKMYPEVLSVVHACFVAVIFLEKKLLKNLVVSEFITIFAYQIKTK